MTSIRDFLMSPEIGRVPSSKVPLNAQEETRFEGLAEESVMIDVHSTRLCCPKPWTDSLISSAPTAITGALKQ